MQSQFIPLFHGLRNHRNVVPTFRERTKRIAAFCRALSWPKTNLGYKIRVLDLSESLAYIRNLIISVRVETINMEGNDESTLVEFIKIKNSRKNNNFLLCCCVRDTTRRKIDDKF